MSDTSMKLYIKLFNDLDILCNGRSIFEESHLTAKLKSLLQYLIINRGTTCKPENIIGELWSGNEQLERKKVLQTYVHRLRNAIAKKNSFDYDFSSYFTIINNKGNYQMEIADEVEFDTDVFMEQASKASYYDEYNDLIKLSKKLASIYDGHYLNECPFENLVKRNQNYYLQNYCAALVIILEKLEAISKYEDIISICESFFALEDLNDSINVIFLRALIKTQQNTYAIRHYDYIDKKIRETFGVNPSNEMNDLYRQLKGVNAVAREKTHYDEDHLKDMINDAIMSHIRGERAKYALARIHLTLPASVKMPKGFIIDVMKGALRKNDMFTQVGKYTVMALLLDAKEEHYETIKRRIQHEIKISFGELNKAKIEISVWPVDHVV